MMTELYFWVNYPFKDCKKQKVCILCLLQLKSRQVRLPTQMSQSEWLNLTEINGATTEHKCEGFWPRHLGTLQPAVQSRDEPKTGRNVIPRPRL